MKHNLLNALVFLCLALTELATAQTRDPLLSFASYSSLPREQAYLHLNKSVLVSGELLGFKAYVLDKKNRLPSTETRNLYVTISDQDNKRIKGMLVRVEQGAAEGIVEIDSLFDTGTYTVRAFTNWMRNFREFNHFEQKIQVLNTASATARDAKPIESSPGIATNSTTTLPDIAFLPEGGYAPLGVETVYGVVAKDYEGYGLPLLSGRIEDEKGAIVSQFKLDHKGLGRFVLTPKAGSRYKGIVDWNGEEITYDIGHIRPSGPGMRLQHMGKRIGLIFQSYSPLDSGFLLTIHNGSDIKGVPIDFGGQSRVFKVLEKLDLFAGVNVITLFDSQGNPMLERLNFNEFGLSLSNERLAASARAVEGDSLVIDLALPARQQGQWQSLSLAVHPSTTQAANSQHNLISYTLLTPYVRGPIQDAYAYFEDPSPEKWFELDLLLMTQGWSSYSWHDIRESPPKALFDFEKGITVTAQDNDEAGIEYFLYPSTNHTGQFIPFEGDSWAFRMDQLFPVGDEPIAFSQVGGNRGLSKPGLFLQFKPSSIPTVPLISSQTLPDRWYNEYDHRELPSFELQSGERVYELEEVVVQKAKSQSDRLENIRNRTMGRVDYFEPDDPRRNQFLASYLSGQGFLVNEVRGQFNIVARNPNSPNNPVPAIFLDDVLLNSFDPLFRFRMDLVDYIVINRSGIGGGLRFGGGVIYIYTKPGARSQFQSLLELQQTVYTVPLSFQEPREYYAPVYNSLSNSFFLKYGTLKWIPEIKPSSDGHLRIRIPRIGSESIQLDLQGMASPGHMVSRKWEVSLPR